MIGYIEEIELCYGVAPNRTPEASFEAAHQMREAFLPGHGDFADRSEALLPVRVPAAKQLEVLQSINDELRGRVLELFGLPEGESVEYEVARDVPWAGFNYYLGGLRSRVVINTDVPVRRQFLIDAAAHETYPGHHTEHAWKEAGLVRDLGLDEESIFLIGTLCPIEGTWALTVTAATVRPVSLVFPRIPTGAQLRSRLRAAIPEALYHDDVHGRPEYRKHLTPSFAEEIRRELSTGQPTGAHTSRGAWAAVITRPVSSCSSRVSALCCLPRRWLRYPSRHL